MSSAYHARCMAVHRERFIQVVRSWLAGLPAEGWRGGTEALGAELDRVKAKHKVPVYVPWSSGLTKTVEDLLPAIEAAGWTVRRTRTARARLITFVKLEAR